MRAGERNGWGGEKNRKGWGWHLGKFKMRPNYSKSKNTQENTDLYKILIHLMKMHQFLQKRPKLNK